MEIRDKATQLYQWIRADTSITDLIDTIGTGPAIIMSNMIAEAYQDLSLIQIYRTSLISPIQVQPVSYTVNCRSSTEYKADNIAEAVYNVINRKSESLKLAKCTVQPCIFEEENHYNTPIEVVILGV